MKGFLVSSSENDLGIGKLIERSGANATVEYFKSISERITKTLSVASLSRVILKQQTRCYLWSEENQYWEAGRIGQRDEQDNTYEVNLPGNRASYIPEGQIYVRCNLLIDDPTETLVLKSHETPFFHDRRFSFVQCLTKQRQVAHGLTGLLSSSITLYPHQAEVVRRVLEDPVQRYLLADEVGLGKTIEAGVILRQYLLDEPRGRAIVLVPQLLVEQWSQELRERFSIEDFGKRVCISSMDELIGLQPLKKTARIGLLIIDEAHHIATGAYSTDQLLQERFYACQDLALHADRLLLLSATPVLNNEKDFLAMLHLLDPLTYKLDDFDAFRDRINKRQDIGRILLSFREGADPFVLKRGTGRLRDLFPNDRSLHILLDELQQLLQSSSVETSKPESVVRSIRTHISDTYRLHRRMLRNRRDSVPLAGRWKAEDAPLEFKEEYDDDERGVKIHELLDEWRVRGVSEALNYQENASDREHELERIFLILFRASGTWLEMLRKVVEVRLALSPNSTLTDEFSPEDLRILSEAPMFDDEGAILNSILEVLRNPSEEGDRIQLLIDMLRRFHQTRSKVVVFTSFRAVHKEILLRLTGKYGNAAVASHDARRGRKEVEADIERFREDANCFVLVSDSSGEEGRNLQLAEWLIHFDLPWSPNRLEQRIGRLDRIGRTSTVKTRVLLGSDVSDEEMTIHEAWYRFLKDGLGIFEHSIASLQFYIDEKLPMLEKTIFRLGAEGLHEAIEKTRQEIEDERLKINEQNALDEIDALDKNVEQYFKALASYDGEYEKIQKASEDWVCEVLHFKRQRDFRSPSAVKYSPTAHTLVPSNVLIDSFLYALSLPGTYSRAVASERAGMNMYRIGNWFINALADYVRWDDRGQAFAMWRHVSNWSPEEGAEWMGFRFNYVIEADLDSVRRVLAEHDLSEVGVKALSRRADALFPPFMETIYLDVSMQEVREEEDAALLEILNRPYNNKSAPKRDYSIWKERLPIIDQLIGFDTWTSLCREARSQSEDLLRSRRSFAEFCEQLAGSAERELARRIDQLLLRVERESGEQYRSTVRELNLERDLSSALLAGIRQPHIRLDSLGFIVISGRAPSIT